MKDPCKGCTCNTCTSSAKNGNIYGCPKKRCRQCELQGFNIKLGYCDAVIEQQEGEIIKVC